MQCVNLCLFKRLPTPYASQVCVQFMANADLLMLATETGAELRVDAKGADDSDSTHPPAYRPHVFPKYPAPVIIQGPTGRRLGLMQYGLIPSFEKNEKPKMVFHNARVETIDEKPSFKEAFVKRRCVIPIESFFEFVDQGQPRKTLLQFSRPKAERLFAAGVYQSWRPSPSAPTIWTFSMITREPTPQILEAGHDRSPYWIDYQQCDAWLQPSPVPAPNLHQILKSIALEYELRIEPTR
jgi:putative SOS response-associated peptidase YedK